MRRNSDIAAGLVYCPSVTVHLSSCCRAPGQVHACTQPCKLKLDADPETYCSLQAPEAAAASQLWAHASSFAVIASPQVHQPHSAVLQPSHSAGRRLQHPGPEPVSCRATRLSATCPADAYLLNCPIQGHIPVLLVHVVVARARLEAHPDAKILDGGGVLLEDLADRQDLAVGLLHLT